MNIVMITGECLPFSKTGGLGDVCYSLSKEFVKNKHNVSVFVPFYKKFDFNKYKEIEKVFTFPVNMGWRKPFANIFKLKYDGIDFYFIQNDYYFSRDGMYGYPDDGERYAFFNVASVTLLSLLDFKVDVCHVHDWQAGMIPCILKENFASDPKLNKIKTVLTIHNPLFKGYINRESLSDLLNLNTYLFDSGKVRFENQVSFLKAGIVYSDKITTVSPTHAWELTTKEGSKGLWYDLTLRKEDFVGILNGMDQDEFNPQTDKTIYKTYNEEDFSVNKLKNKTAFCKEHNLDPKLPLYSVVSRLTSQKGLDLIYAMAEYVVTHNGNFAILGSGERDGEESFNHLVRTYPKNTFVYIGYNDEIAHKLYASSDFFIMPSAFEPCGLGQMIAQRYGTLPIVRQTGGLKDSVICYKESEKNQAKANGFGFEDYNKMVAMKEVAITLDLYENKPDLINQLVANAFKTDNSWVKSAKQYLKLYKLIEK